MLELVFWGATGQAKVLHELISSEEMRLVALVDNRLIPSPIPGVALLCGESGLDAWLVQRGGPNGLSGAVAVGGKRGGDRLQLMELMKGRGITIITLIHRTAFVADTVTVGEGCQILANSAVCTYATLGRGVIVNTGASVDHDGLIGDGAHLGPGARLAGEVTVGARAFIGTGAVVLPQITIGDDAVVGAGAVVTRNVGSGTTVVGNPARPINNDH